MPKNLQQVEYTQFRNILSLAAGQKVKNRGLNTIVYDQDNHPLAILKAASIDALGRCRPAEYYIRCSAA